MMPHFFETEINSAGYFTFLLPASTALGIDSGKILEISVDYSTALDGNRITANAWAREQNLFDQSHYVNNRRKDGARTRFLKILLHIISGISTFNHSR